MTTAFIVITTYTLEQARGARYWLPRQPKANLHVLRPSIALRPRASTHPTIPHVSRIPEPVVPVGQLLYLERALLHPHAVLVARALADVDRCVRAPAVAEGLTGLPVARPARVDRWCVGAVGKRTGEDVELAKGGGRGGCVMRSRKVAIITEVPALCAVMAPFVTCDIAFPTFA
jgi:hypothetical protein